MERCEERTSAEDSGDRPAPYKSGVAGAVFTSIGKACRLRLRLKSAGEVYDINYYVDIKRNVN